MQHRNLHLVAFAMLAVGLMPGCGLRNVRTIHGTGSLAATPPGPSAVLRVAVGPAKSPRSRDIIWGSIDTTDADRQFAELLAHTARNDGGMNVAFPVQVEEQLELEGFKPTLQPGTEELRRYVKALDCGSYLTAELKRWGYGYIFFLSSATIEYRVSCHRADNDETVWEVDVRRQARGMDNRDVALLALRETFQWLRERDRIGNFGSP